MESNPANDDPKPLTETENDGAHMGATEAQVIPMRPPTDELDELIEKSRPRPDDTQSANGELTPG